MTTTMMNNEYRFYDTSSLLLKVNTLFNEEENIVISSVTLNELENIKSSVDKDPYMRYCARHILNLLAEHIDKYEVYIYKEKMLTAIHDMGLPTNNDTKILSCAIDYDSNIHPDETVFITNDIALYTMANLFFGKDSIEFIKDEIDDNYTGYKTIQLDDDTMAEFYSNQNINMYDLQVNQYLLVYNSNNELVDKLVWVGDYYRQVSYNAFESTYFGKIKPYNNDPLQALAADSLLHNPITMLKGPAGSGKSILALGFLFYLLEKHQIDKIVVFCNTVAVKGAAKLGYYPGDKNSKLLDSQIGNLLSSKLGDRIAVERLIDENKLVLLPLADIRGYDTSGMRAGVYISEAQNMDVNLMKLSLQRIGPDSICIIDGDAFAQVDDINFDGINNGMKRASKIFRGHSIYGEVELQKIHRSVIAELANDM